MTQDPSPEPPPQSPPQPESSPWSPPHQPTAPPAATPALPVGTRSGATTDGFAITALVLGVVGGGLAAVGFGWASLSRIRRSGRPGRGLAVAGIVLGVAWTVVGAVVAGVVIRTIGTSTSSRPSSSSGTAKATGGTVALTDLRVRDCVRDDLGSGTATEAVVVPCSQAHHSEVFSLAEATGTAAYPGDSAVRSQAEDLCTKAAPSNLVSGLPSDAELLYSYPKAANWLTGDRVVACLVNTPGSTSTVELVNAAAR